MFAGVSGGWNMTRDVLSLSDDFTWRYTEQINTALTWPHSSTVLLLNSMTCS